MAQDREERLLERAKLLENGVVNPYPFTTVLQPPCIPEVGKVARHGGLGELQDRHQVADAELLFFQKQGQDPETGFVFEGLENCGYGFHGSKYIR